MMLVFLRVEKGPHAGRRIDLKPGQAATLGRTEFADFSFEKDLQMADLQCRVLIDNQSVELNHLADDHETLVNGEPVSKSRLSAGDEIQVGQTFIKVLIESDSWSSAPESPSSGDPTATEPSSDSAEVDIVKICKDLSLDEESLPKAAQHATLDSLLQELKSEENWLDAVRIQAHLLPVADGVRCVIQTVSEFPEIPIAPQQQKALDAAAEWAIDPDEDKRRVCEALAEENNNEGIGASVAMAAFFGGGSIAPPESEEEVFAEEFVSSAVLAGAVFCAAGECPPDSRDTFMIRFLENANSPLPAP